MFLAGSSKSDGTHRSFALSLPSCHTVTLRATLQLGFDTIIWYGLPWVFGFCYRHQICNYYRTATFCNSWHNKKAQWVRVPLPSPMACLGPGTHGVKGTLQSVVPILQRLGTHHPHTQINILLNVTVWLWKTKTFNVFLQCHPSARIKSVFLERVVLGRLILETDVQEADLRVAKHSMTLTWD